MFFFLIFITLMGMLTLFSIRFPEDRLFLDSPVPIKPALAHAQPLQSDFQPQVALAVIETKKAVSQRVSPRQAIAGNAGCYSAGFCTYGVASWTNVPCGLGNANLWDDRARAMGFKVSSVPAVGTVGQSDAGRAGHVVLVRAIDDGRVLIKEMNYAGLWSVRERWSPISAYEYIYF